MPGDVADVFDLRRVQFLGPSGRRAQPVPAGGYANSGAQRTVYANDGQAADLGAELVVASWGGDWLGARLEGLAGIHHLDLDPVLRQGAYVFEHDPHWNPEGHAAVARTMAVFLRERGLP